MCVFVCGGSREEEVEMSLKKKKNKIFKMLLIVEDDQWVHEVLLYRSLYLSVGLGNSLIKKKKN